MDILKIAVCDDDPHIVDYIVENINRFFERKKIDFQVSDFTDSKVAVDYMGSNLLDIVFLDIEMPKIDGIEIAKKIREKSLSTQIVFITGYDKYQSLVFPFHVFDYVMKPLKIDDILRVLNQLYLYTISSNYHAKTLEIIKTKEGIISVDISTIVYFESRDRKVFMHLSDDSVHRVIAKLKSIVVQFSKYEEFFQTHKAFLINLNCIKIYRKKECEIVLENDLIIPLSQLRVKDFNLRYLKVLELWGEI